MAETKKPQDHKTKNTTEDTMTVHYGGQDWTIRKDVFDDYELLDLIARVDNGEGQLFPLVVRGIFGDQHPKVIEALRPDDGGRITVERVGQWVQGFMLAVAPNF